MDSLFTSSLQVTINQAKATKERVSREKALAAKLKEEEDKKAAVIAKNNRIKSVVGDLGKKITEAAEKGLNYVEIPISSDDMAVDGYYRYTGYPKPNSKVAETCKFLKDTIQGLILEIYDNVEKWDGPYNEECTQHNFRIRIYF